MTDARPVAIVTGGARGIGLGIARALAADGWSLAIAGVRDPADVKSTIETLAEGGGRVHYQSLADQAAEKTATTDPATSR